MKLGNVVNSAGVESTQSESESESLMSESESESLVFKSESLSPSPSPRVPM